MTNRIIIGLAVVATSLLSCTQKEPLSPEQGANGSLVITAGFEQRFPEEAAVDSKTYLAGGSEIRWSSNAIDKVIYVFDSDGQKNVFTSTSTTAESVRSFTGNIPSGRKPKYILWTGKLENQDNTILTETSGGLGSETIASGGFASLDTKAGIAPSVIRFSGSCLSVSPTQTITNQNSFVSDGNISIMKEGDSCLKSVFGYLRYRIPVSDLGNYATIKSIKITADENIAYMDHTSPNWNPAKVDGVAIEKEIIFPVIFRLE